MLNLKWECQPGLTRSAIVLNLEVQVEAAKPASIMIDKIRNVAITSTHCISEGSRDQNLVTVTVVHQIPNSSSSSHFSTHDEIFQRYSWTGTLYFLTDINQSAHSPQATQKSRL